MPSAMSSNRDLEARLRGALATCQQLREENRIRKELLAKYSISLSAESEGQISEPTLTAAASEVSSALAPLTQAEKIRLFRSWFRGRDDVYAERWRTKYGECAYRPASERNWE